MKKLMIVTLMAVAALTASAQRRSPTRRGAAGADGRAALAQGKVIQFGRKVLLGSACLQAAPTANGNSAIPKVFKGQRRWIVPELEYQTAVDWLDEPGNT